MQDLTFTTLIAVFEEIFGRGLSGPWFSRH